MVDSAPDSPTSRPLDAAAFDARLAEIARPLLATAPGPLRDSILYSLLGPGKRIRPRLAAAVGSALGLAPEISERLGAALEMVHAFTLVHDDLPAMDDDDFRRGRPTNHKVYGEAVALLAGDSLLPLAYETLLPLRTELGPDRVYAVFGALLEASGARGVIAGQVAESALDSARGVEELWEVFRLKTGALFRAALALPALAAGSPAAPALGRLGEGFGIAFQIADDLEDLRDGSGARAPAPRHHVAAWMVADEARAHARRILDAAAAPVFLADERLRTALAPFLREIEAKLAAEARP